MKLFRTLAVLATLALVACGSSEKPVIVVTNAAPNTFQGSPSGAHYLYYKSTGGNISAFPVLYDNLQACLNAGRLLEQYGIASEKSSQCTPKHVKSSD